jgi:hypothetical protein
MRHPACGCFTFRSLVLHHTADIPTRWRVVSGWGTGRTSPHCVTGSQNGPSLANLTSALTDSELQLNPPTSLEQIEAIRSGRLDAGFVFNMPKADRHWITFRSHCNMSNWPHPKDIP